VADNHNPLVLLSESLLQCGQMQPFLFIVSYLLVQLCFQGLLNSVINQVCVVFGLVQLLY